MLAAIEAPSTSDIQELRRLTRLIERWYNRHIVAVNAAERARLKSAIHALDITAGDIEERTR